MKCVKADSALAAGGQHHHHVEQQQGPFEFRKILKPASRNTSRSDDSWPQSSSSEAGAGDEDGGPFDFRRLLRRTNNAPTDTLKRLRAGTALSAASSTSV